MREWFIQLVENPNQAVASLKNVAAARVVYLHNDSYLVDPASSHMLV